MLIDPGVGSGLLEAAPDAIVGVTSGGRITLANAQSARLFGYDKGELLGQPIELLVPETARGVHPGHRRRYFADPTPRPMGAGKALAGRRRDGTEFPAEISLSGLETEDGVIVSAAVRDVTDRLEAQAERERLKAEAEGERFEARLHQSERLESLGQLAGGVAHDFNNLLAVILNYAGFVAEEIDEAAATEGGQHWETARRDMEQIQRAAERATLLTPGLWRTLADPGQVEQVLVNLAVNARDAMWSGGMLTIDTSNLELDEEYATQRPSLDIGRYSRPRRGSGPCTRGPSWWSRTRTPCARSPAGSSPGTATTCCAPRPASRRCRSPGHTRAGSTCC